MELSGDVSTQVIRQGTFDTDSTSTLRSKSGGVTRGAIALPVITDQPPLRTPIIKQGTYNDLEFSTLTEGSSNKSKSNKNKVGDIDAKGKQKLSSRRVNHKSLVQQKVTNEDELELKYRSIEPINEETDVAPVQKSKVEKEATKNKVLKNSVQISKPVDNKFDNDRKRPNSKDDPQQSEKSVSVKSDKKNKSKNLDNRSNTPVQNGAIKKEIKPKIKSGNKFNTSAEEDGKVSELQEGTQTVRRFTKNSDNIQVKKSELETESTENNISGTVDSEFERQQKPIADRIETEQSQSKESDTLDQQISSRPPPSTNYPGRPNYNSMDSTNRRQPGSERMVESYESVYMERQTLLTAEVAYNKRIKQLEDELNQFLRTIEDLRSENRSLGERIEELESGNFARKGEQSASTVVINTETDELLLKIKLLEQENKKLTTTVKETDDKVKVLTTKNSGLEKENEELKSKVKFLETQSQEMKKEIADKDDQLSEEKAQNKTAELKKELKTTKDQLKQAKTAEDTLSLEIVALKSMEVNMKKETESLQVENKKLQMEIEKYKEAAQTDENEQKDGQVTARDKMELKSQIVSLQTENQTINEENIKLKAENLKQVKTIHDLEKTSKSFQTSVTSVESEKLSEIQSIQNENAKLKSEISSMKESHKDVDTKIKTLQTENKTMSTALAQKKSELDELMKALSGENIEDELQTVKDEKEKLVTQMKENETKVEESTKLLEEVKIQRDQLENEKKKIQEELGSASKSNESLKSEMEKLKSEQKKLSSEMLTSKEKELSDAKSECDKYKKELENLKQEKKKEQEQLKKKIHDTEFQKQAEIDRLREQLDSQKAQTAALKVSTINHKEVEELRQELRIIYDKYSEMTIELEQKDRMETRAFEMTMRIDQLNAKMKQMENEKRDWIIDREKMNDIEASNKRLTEENIRLKKLLDSKTHINGNRSGEVAHRIDHLERLQKDAVTRVRQLEGWVGGMYNGSVDKPARALINKKPYSRFNKKDRSRRPKENEVVRIELQEPKRARSLDDVNTLKAEEESLTDVSTPPLSLPSIHTKDGSLRGFHGPGYSQIHKRRILEAAKRKA